MPITNNTTLSSYLFAIGNAIRDKLDSNETFKLSEMPVAIRSINEDGISADVRTALGAAGTEEHPRVFSFTTYTDAQGTELCPNSLGYSNITDINIPKLQKIYSHGLTLNNTIAKKLEPLDIQYLGEKSLVGSCDSLELYQNTNFIKDSCFDELNCPNIATPYSPRDNTGNSAWADYKKDFMWIPESMTKIADTLRVGLTRIKNVILSAPRVAVLSYYHPSYVDAKKIFVPKALLNTYKNATNWSTISDQIYAIEDSADILQGKFSDLDKRFFETNILQKLIYQGQVGRWVISLAELETIANDLTTNGEQSIYYPYRNNLVINDALMISDEIYLVISDTFKYDAATGSNKIPLSGIIIGKKSFKKNSGGTYTGLPLVANSDNSDLIGRLVMNDTKTNAGGFSGSKLKTSVSSGGTIYTAIPYSLRNKLKAWKYDNNNHSGLFAPLSVTEIYGNVEGLLPDYEKYGQLKLFNDLGITSENHELGNYVQTKESLSDLKYQDTFWTRSIPTEGDTFYYIDTDGAYKTSDADLGRYTVWAVALG